MSSKNNSKVTTLDVGISRNNLIFLNLKNGFCLSGPALSNDVKFVRFNLI